MSDYDGSSSDDGRPHPTINLPSVNLAVLRKKDKKNNAKTNLAKARNKLSGKSPRFGEANYRDSILSNSSNTNLSNLSTDSDSDSILARETPLAGNPHLPSFSFKVPSEEMHYNEIHGDDDSGSESLGEFNQPIIYQEDSSDEELHQMRLHEMDITDQPKGSFSSNTSTRSADHSTRSGETGRRRSIRALFHRSSVSDHPDAPSHSDSFLGRVLNFSGGNSGLSGGGLVPGASRAGDEHLDGEKEIGRSEDHSIELQNLNYAELNEEAENLISSHAPKNPRVAFHTPKYDLETLREEGSSVDRQNTHSRTNTETSSAFYQPNPDLLREDLDFDLQDDDFIDEDGEYIAPPSRVHAGVLSSLLKLYQNSQSKSTTSFQSVPTTLAEELLGPESLYDSKNTSTHDFTQLKTSFKLGQKKLASKFKKTHLPTSPRDSSDESDSGALDGDAAKLPSFQNARPKAPKTNRDPKYLGKRLKAKRYEQKLRITVHIADILQRQRFIIRMCRALMLYGAPTHRLEEYMVMTSRVLEIDGQFVYFPGTMIVAFGDAATRTSEVHLVRCAQGLNLSKLADTHKIYKEVVHDLIGVDDATKKLDDLMKKRNAYSPWICVFLYGLGSASVCTWGFGGGWLDIPISFGIGLLIGYLQFFVSSMSNLYSSVFEVTSSIVVAFVARGIGSINHGNTFCFGAIAQGSLALILPGYIILCGSLELQSKNIVAGSVRMFYAIIYSLFLGFGITLGAALYGWVDSNATNQSVCVTGHGLDDKWRIFFVPLFSLCLGLINQARVSQLPVMILISSIAYIGTFFASKHFSNVTEFTASIGAFIIGILGNMYSRIGKGMAVSAMLPAIFVQVPSGIASKSTLLSGIATANKITNSSSSTSSSDLSSLSFGATMVEVAIGISVGLFAAALVVYPFGKRRTGLFTL